MTGRKSQKKKKTETSKDNFRRYPHNQITTIRPILNKQYQSCRGKKNSWQPMGYLDRMENDRLLTGLYEWSSLNHPESWTNPSLTVLAFSKWIIPTQPESTSTRPNQPWTTNLGYSCVLVRNVKQPEPANLGVQFRFGWFTKNEKTAWRFILFCFSYFG